MNQSGVHPNSRAAVSQSNRERAAAARRERELRARTPHPTPHLDAARDEFGSTRPALAVESLEDKLERHLPGARVVDTGAHGDERFVVFQRGRYAEREVGSGASRREAIDRAIWLFGSRR